MSTDPEERAVRAMFYIAVSTWAFVGVYALAMIAGAPWWGALLGLAAGAFAMGYAIIWGVRRLPGGDGG